MPLLFITHPEDPSPSKFRLQMDSQEPVTIGRDDGNSICIPITSVSNAHCSIVRIQGGYMIHDDGSTNGVILDGVRVMRHRLCNGDTLSIGHATLRYRETPQEREVLDSEGTDSDSLMSVSYSRTRSSAGGLSEPTVKMPVPDPTIMLDGNRVQEQASSVENCSPDRSIVHRTEHNLGVIIVYAVVIFVFGFGAGLTYKHNDLTGEFLPAVWIENLFGSSQKAPRPGPQSK